MKIDQSKEFSLMREKNEETSEEASEEPDEDISENSNQHEELVTEIPTETGKPYCFNANKLCLTAGKEGQLLNTVITVGEERSMLFKSMKTEQSQNFVEKEVGTVSSIWVFNLKISLRKRKWLVVNS